MNAIQPLADSLLLYYEIFCWPIRWYFVVENSSKKKIKITLKHNKKHIHRHNRKLFLCCSFHYNSMKNHHSKTAKFDGNSLRKNAEVEPFRQWMNTEGVYIFISRTFYKRKSLLCLVWNHLSPLRTIKLWNEFLN